MSKILGITGIIVLIVLLIGGLQALYYYNTEASLRNGITAQQQVDKNIFDRVWKVISQQAQVTGEYKDSFKAAYTDIMTARYNNGSGKMMSWIQEHNPDFDSSLFKTLMNTIESNRKDFENCQDKLADLKREHDTLLDRFPGNIYLTKLFGKKHIDVQYVTSGKTTESFRTGEDNDVDLFKKEDKKK